MIYFGLRYHRTHDGEIGARIEGSLPLELLWSVIPTIIAMVMFGWGASVFYHLRRPPDDAMHIYAVGKQWMWKFQHLEGQREINELHIPAGRPIKITISSEDVLHSLYFPAFRTKMDAIPGRYTELWFEANTPGHVPHFLRRVLRHQPLRHDRQCHRAGAVRSIRRGCRAAARRARWRSAAPGCSKTSPATPATSTRGQGRGPSLKGIVGTTVELQDGNTVVVDEAYLRESILNSQAKIVKGYQPLMPAFQGLISEENLRRADRTREVAVAASDDRSRPARTPPPAHAGKPAEKK